MKKTKKTTRWLFSLFVGVMAIIFGINGSLLMADAAPMTDGGTTEGGNATEHADGGTGGVSTESGGRATTGEDNPEFYAKDVDKRIIKIRPMATPVDQISRYATAQHSDSFECKYYSVGTRPMRTTVKDHLAASSTVTTTIKVADPEMFTLDDTIRVVGVKATVDYKGNRYNDGKHKVIPDLVLCVCDKDASGDIVVYAINGTDVNGNPYGVPELQANQKLVRMGKSCGELDVQTGRFNNLPTAEVQYCQNFMMQVEQSTFDKIAAKEVDWNFNDQEEDSVYDMRLGMENSFLFGDQAVITHSKKDGMRQWFCKGIWWMAGKDIELGHVATEKEVNDKNYEKDTCVISDNDLVDISEDLFVGTGLAAQRKVVLAGSKVISAFSKINSDKFRLKDSVEAWNLRFKSWETDFGEILMIHSEIFDQNGMEDCAFALDPEFLVKKTHLSWGRNVLDLKTAGVRNTDAVVLQEVSCLILKYPKAHARMKLASGKTVFKEAA